MEARYLNVDLIIKSDFDLTPLVEYLEGKVFFLWKELGNDHSSIGFETNQYNTSGPEEDILELLNIVEELPDVLKPLWSKSNSRIMDIGYESGAIGDPINSSINANTIQRLSQIGSALNIRIYPKADSPV